MYRGSSAGGNMSMGGCSDPVGRAVGDVLNKVVIASAA